MKCRICQEQHYHQTYYDPEEPCICGHGVIGESPWSYAGWRGVLAWFKYTVLIKIWNKTAFPINEWLYKSWDY